MRNASLVAILAAVFLLAPAGTQAQNRISDPTNPNSCKDHWEAIGLPTGKGSRGSITIVCHLGYIVGHSDPNKTPAWVIERLNVGLTKGDASREDQDFQADDALPPKAQAKPTDYDHSGFDQGHNAPAADFAGKQPFLNDTFFLSNAVPQVGIGFNRSIWRSLETQIRSLVGDNRPELYVITGSVQQENNPIKVDSDICGTKLTLPELPKKSICPENRDNDKARCAAGVAVPAAMYKIVYDPASQQAFAVLMENKNHTGLYKSGHGGDYIKAHRVGIATIEDLTGLQFFSKLPDRRQRQMRANCVDPKFH